MKKFNDKWLLSLSSYCLKLTIMTKLCVLLLICTMTTVSAGTVYTPVSVSSSAEYFLTSPDNDEQGNVTGTIKDASTGEALAGVTILIKGTTTGQISDGNGKFSIRIPDREAVLVFSFIGYTPQEIRVQQGSVVNISLVTDTKQIDEVVVVGYGVQKKESVVGAITQVSNATLMQSGTSNVSNAISGKLSGVLTIQATGEPGSNSSEIIIRGLSSWNGSQPLVLVDGVERDFSRLDPNEISTISVLKDASATAVFGAKGANGVIVVTSKRGAIGKPKLDISYQTGMQKATRIPDHISSFTTMTLLNVARKNGGQWQSILPDNILNEYANPSNRLNALRYPNVNWFDEITAPFAPTTNANMNISGGTEFAKYFLSLGYQYQGNFFKGSRQGYVDNRYYNHQFNYRINVDFALTKSTTLSLNVGGEVDVKNNPSGASWRNLYATGPARYPAYFPSWVLNEIPDPDYPDDTGIRLAANFGEYTGNPYTSFSQPQFNRDLGSRLFTDLIFNQKLDAITKGLSFNGKVSLSTYYSNRMLTLSSSYNYPDYTLDYSKLAVNANGNIIPTGQPWTRNGQTLDTYRRAPFDINVGGLNGGYYSDLYYELALNYNRSFGKHSITALGLFNRQQKNSGTEFPFYNEGLVGRATYDYNKKYLLEINVGYTGSERFAPTNRFGFFPSAAVGWVVSEEQFFKNAVPWMNKLKFRYSDGYVGSDYARSRWLYNSSYFKDDRGYIREDLGANMFAQWERAHKRDIGFEIGIFKNVFTLSVDFFDEYRDMMLLTPRSVTMFIGNSFKELNLGIVKKHGFEVEAEFRKNIGPNFEYFVRGLFGFNENRVVYKDDPPYAPDYVKLAGKPLTDMLSVEFNLEGLEMNQVQLTGTGYYTSVNDIHNNPSAIDLTKLVMGDYKFLDFTADGTITSLDKYPGKGLTYPPITYSLATGFRYKNFDFNFMLQGNVGKYVHFNQGFEVEFIKGDWRVHESALDYWSPTNPNAGHQTLHYFAGSSQDNLFWGGGEEDRGYQAIIMDRFLRKADYLRLKDLYIGYTFNSGFMKKIMGVSNINVYASGNNLFTITKLIEGDPERKDFQQGFYPILTTMRLGLKLNF
jgi:TonB-linked SusC/RagA family outer membrane protein